VLSAANKGVVLLASMVVAVLSLSLAAGLVLVSTGVRSGVVVSETAVSIPPSGPACSSTKDGFLLVVLVADSEDVGILLWGCRTRPD